MVAFQLSYIFIVCKSKAGIACVWTAHCFTVLLIIKCRLKLAYWLSIHYGMGAFFILFSVLFPSPSLHLLKELYTVAASQPLNTFQFLPEWVCRLIEKISITFIGFLINIFLYIYILYNSSSYSFHFMWIAGNENAIRILDQWKLRTKANRMKV